MTSEQQINLQELSAQMQRVADELDIRNLVASIYLMTDQEPDLQIYGQNFSDDAIWERVDGGVAGPHTNTRLVGRDQIIADRRTLRDRGHTGPTSRRRHLITTVAVEFEDDGTARARSKFLLIHGDKPRPVIDSVGEYDDTFRRTEAGWKLCHRRYSSLGTRN